MPIDPGVIPSVPTPVPQSSDPANFAARGDATMTALPGVVVGMNTSAAATNQNAQEVFDAAGDISAAAAVAADAAGLRGESNSPITVAAGVKDVVLLSAKPGLVELNRRIVLILKADSSIKIFCTITNVTNSSTFQVTATTGGVFGSGNYSSWHVMDAAFFASAATAAEVRAGTSEAAPMTPKSIYDGLAEVELVDGANIYTDGDSALDMSKFINGVVTLAGNRALPNPTNATPGKTGRIRCIQGSGGSHTLSFGSNWKRQGGDPTLSTAADANDIVAYDVVTPTFILYDLIRNPT